MGWRVIDWSLCVYACCSACDEDKAAGLGSPLQLPSPLPQPPAHAFVPHPGVMGVFSRCRRRPLAMPNMGIPLFSPSNSRHALHTS